MIEGVSSRSVGRGDTDGIKGWTYAVVASGQSLAQGIQIRVSLGFFRCDRVVVRLFGKGCFLAVSLSWFFS